MNIHLSQRSRQPGSDVSFRSSEEDFFAGLQLVCPAGIEATKNPLLLKKLFAGETKSYGLLPEATLFNPENKRRAFFEVKKQGPRGNAEERAMKHHTSRFQAVLKEAFGFDYHSYFAVFCDELATNARYTSKFPFYIEPTHYLCWAGYDLDLLSSWISGICERYLCD